MKNVPNVKMGMGIFASSDIPILLFIMAKENEDKQATLEDFYIPEKVDAFCRRYAPANVHTFTTEVFNEERLREFFKAYVFPLGDPLKLYVGELKNRGYAMNVTLTGELGIIVKDNMEHDY